MQIRITRIRQNYAQILTQHSSFIETFMTNVATKYKQTFLTMMQNPEGRSYAQPLVTAVLSNVSDIILSTNRENGPVIKVEDVVKFVNLFLESKRELIPEVLYHIPNYNLYHYGNICHLNTCLLMLASMHYLVEAFINLPNDINSIVQSLKTVLLNSYSEIDINPSELFHLIAALDIDINQIEPAEETMIKILKLFIDSTPKDLLVHWDFAHSTLPDKADTDLTLDQIVDKYQPLYLLANGQDFNVAKEVQQNNQFIPMYTTGKYVYKLASVIVYHSHHFINVFIDDNGQYIVKDDLCHRFTQPTTNLARLVRGLQITEVCYVKWGDQTTYDTINNEQPLTTQIQNDNINEPQVRNNEPNINEQPLINNHYQQIDHGNIQYQTQVQQSKGCNISSNQQPNQLMYYIAGGLF